ncbi:hypothetical protein HMPREF0297_1833 [Corynebacterium jeikeium ATCC 43734]|nr:hypothetical protein HMPREF0297_1833 [Corynebacterium jeikeium ATCC 43734]
MSWSLPGGFLAGGTRSACSRTSTELSSAVEVKSAFRVSAFESTNLNNHVNAG